MKAEKIIRLRMQNSTFCRRIRVVQGDTGRVFRFILEDITMDGSEQARVYAKKPDGTEVYNDCEVVSPNEVLMERDSGQIFAAIGVVQAEIQISKSGKTITTYTFEFDVEKSLTRTGAIQSSSEYGALEIAIAKAEGFYNPTFSEAATRNNINSGESIPTLFGKVKKWFTDLNTLIKLVGSADISGIGNGTVTGALLTLNSKASHNIPRLVPKDITSYYNDGSLWKRLNGTGGYTLYQDIYVGDYFKMSRPISAKNQNSDYQLTGSQYVTIASIGGLANNGDNLDLTPNHLVMVPGQGFGGTQHFGRSRMNPSNTTVGGYKGSEMNTTVLGAVATAGSTTADATINQQLYAEFGAHLKKTRELITNRISSNDGCSNGWEWVDAQAILMSEVELYGSTVWSSSGFDTGNANHQFELFANSKSAINNRSAWYWMKDVASASEFCDCNNNGRADCDTASGVGRYVRPRFVIVA